MSPQNTSRQLGNQVEQKVQKDSKEDYARFEEMRRFERGGQIKRKVKYQILPGRRREKKELALAEAQDDFSGIFQSEENLSLVFVLGLTLSLINDFSDLVTWHNASLVGQTIDITALILLASMMTFVSRAYFFSVSIVLFAFLLEMMPVVGVLPWWSAGVLAWYFINRRRKN